MLRPWKIGLILLVVSGCVPQAGPGDLVNIPEPSEYMRGYFPLKVVFDRKNPNEMVILMTGGRSRQVRLLAISMPVGQKLWEFAFDNRVVKDIYPDPDGGIWVFVEKVKLKGRRRVRDFSLVKVKGGSEVSAVDLPDTVYTDWYSFVTDGERFIGKPTAPPIYFTVCDRTGSIQKAFPTFKTLKEFYDAFRKFASKPNFRKFVALTGNGSRLVVISEALDSMWIYDIENGDLIKGVHLGEPQIIPRGGGKAVIMNRVVSVGVKGGDTVWVLTLKDIRYFKDGDPIYRVDFGDKRFLTGTIKNDTFYWITYDKSVRIAPVSKYTIVEVQKEGG
ncbi:MAG: hypothetical protein GXO39_02380 [Thermotogae bacterium]|nr:hypothetical protein [Thermotogota bacterium]